MKTVISRSCKNIRNDFLTTFLLLVFLFPAHVLSQSEYKMTLANITKISERIIEFEIYISSTNGVFILTSYQCALLFNGNEIANDGHLKFEYIKGSSQLSNLPNVGVTINSTDSVFKLTFASGAGTDSISELELLIGRFQLQNTTSFAPIDPNITWCFEGFITAMLTGGSFKNITNPTSHKYDNINQSKPKFAKNSQNIEVPNEYKLFQNYPNPFNPSTKIRYTIPSIGNSLTQFVQLKVFDILGNEVETLVNEEKLPGFYEVELKSAMLSSGTYLIKLNTQNFTNVIKIILIK